MSDGGANGHSVSIVGRSPALRSVLERLDRLARSELPVLILGETGTGKELAARRVHSLSRRQGSAFLPVNCAALSETLILSDLFGHVRGAFTGADRDRPGVFEAARGGTVFLDEVGDLPMAAQGMLLRVLQEGEIRRLGESRPRRVDVRIVAATHRHLEKRVDEGRFRGDLLFRLKVGTVELPPLRERGRDILLLADHFLARQPGGARLSWSADAQRKLLGCPWPGNVRQLEGAVAVAVALADGRRIEARHLELPESRPVEGRGYRQQVEALRRRLVTEALDAARGNRAEAARRLGLSRQAMSYLAGRFGL